MRRAIVPAARGGPPRRGRRGLAAVAAVLGALVVGSCAADDSTRQPEPAGAPSSSPAPVPGTEPTEEPEPTAEPAVTAAGQPSAPPTVTEPTVTLPPGRYPPGDETDLAAMVDPLVADLGVRFTYGSLIDRSTGGTFAPSPTGDHLAVYVEPVDASFSDARYIANTWELARRLTPLLFDAYPGLVSWDICQEPRPVDNAEPRPPPVTQLDIFRDAAATVDWDRGRLADLVAAARTDTEITLVIDPSLEQHPDFVAELRALD